jgi:hypothetical protein
MVMHHGHSKAGWVTRDSRSFFMVRLEFMPRAWLLSLCYSSVHTLYSMVRHTRMGLQLFFSNGSTMCWVTTGSHDLGIIWCIKIHTSIQYCPSLCTNLKCGYVVGCKGRINLHYLSLHVSKSKVSICVMLTISVSFTTVNILSAKTYHVWRWQTCLIIRFHPIQ